MLLSSLYNPIKPYTEGKYLEILVLQWKKWDQKFLFISTECGKKHPTESKWWVNLKNSVIKLYGQRIDIPNSGLVRALLTWACGHGVLKGRKRREETQLTQTLMHCVLLPGFLPVRAYANTLNQILWQVWSSWVQIEPVKCSSASCLLAL